MAAEHKPLVMELVKTKRTYRELYEALLDSVGDMVKRCDLCSLSLIEVDDAFVKCVACKQFFCIDCVKDKKLASQCTQPSAICFPCASGRDIDATETE